MAKAQKPQDTDVKKKTLFTVTKEVLDNTNIRVNILLLVVGAVGLASFAIQGTTIYNGIKTDINIINKDVIKIDNEVAKIDIEFTNQINAHDKRINEMEMKMVEVRTKLNLK